MIEESRVGNILVSVHKRWSSVATLLSKPNYTSINMFYDSNGEQWIVGRVMSQIERDEAEDKAEQSSDDHA